MEVGIRAQAREERMVPMLRLCAVLVCLLLFLLLPGCQGPADPPETEAETAPETLQVVTTIYPVTFFTREVGGDRVRVEPLLPEGADAHHWEPTARTMTALEQADLLIVNGADMELWLDDLLGALDKEMPVVDTTGELELLAWDEEQWLEELDAGSLEARETDNGTSCDHEHAEDLDSSEDHLHDHGPGCDHQHGDHDPHVWLDPLLAAEQARAIKEALIEADPEGEDVYRQGYEELARQLEDLHARWEEGLAGVERREVVLNHASFGYPAQRYGLVQIPLMGVHAEGEPGAPGLQRIVQLGRERGVTRVYAEPIADTRLAETVASEIGAEVDVLHPLGNLTAEDLEAGEDYFSLMRENLAALQRGLGG